jgi:hypothetical protein
VVHVGDDGDIAQVGASDRCHVTQNDPVQFRRGRDAGIL